MVWISHYVYHPRKLYFAAQLVREFWDRNDGRIWQFNPRLQELGKEALATEISKSPAFMESYKELLTKETNLNLAGSMGMRKVMDSPVDEFDLPPPPVATYVPDATTGAMTRLNSRAELLRLRREERAVFMQSQYDKVDQTREKYHLKNKHFISFMTTSPVKGRMKPPKTYRSGMSTSRSVWAL